MTKRVLWNGMALMCLVSAGACTDVKSPYAPSEIAELREAESRAAIDLASAVPPAFPAVSRPARVFVAAHWPVYAMHGSPLASRYVLYEDGTFSLQYASVKHPFFEYRGTYEEEDGAITFYWNGCCGSDAKGLLRGEALAVEYSEIMQHADFLNGIYLRAN